MDDVLPSPKRRGGQVIIGVGLIVIVAVLIVLAIARDR